MPSLILICPKCDFETRELNVTLCPKCRAILMKISKEEEEWEGKIIESRYRIVKIIGKGGMGIICEAEQIPLERKVAIKLLRREFYYDAMTVRRFLKEAQAASKLNHPNIVTIFDFSQAESGVLFLAMEYLVGKTLREELNEKGKLSFERTKMIVSQICLALSHAHSQGVIHCDLKPENIILVKKDGEEFLKVLDFGIAKIIGGKTQTKIGLVAGTAEYISPEQIENKTVDARADLYSLACIVYECLCGQTPYVGENPYRIISLHLSGEFKSVSEFRSDLPKEIDYFFRRALHKQREWRFQSAEEFKNIFFSLSEKKAALSVSQPFPSEKSKKEFLKKALKRYWFLYFFIFFAVLAVFVFYPIFSPKKEEKIDQNYPPVIIVNEVMETEEEIKEVKQIIEEEIKSDTESKDFIETFESVTEGKDIEIEKIIPIETIIIEVEKAKKEKKKSITTPIKKEEIFPPRQKKDEEFKIKRY